MKEEIKKIVKSVCMIDDMRRVPQAEKEGAIGIAIVLAYLKGARANLEDMSKKLDMPRYEIEIPYRRLLTNGVFSQRYNIREDIVLVGECKKSDWQQSAEKTRNSWCILAGVAGGLTGLRETPIRRDS